MIQVQGLNSKEVCSRQYGRRLRRKEFIAFKQVRMIEDHFRYVCHEVFNLRRQYLGGKEIHVGLCIPSINLGEPGLFPVFLCLNYQIHSLHLVIEELGEVFLNPEIGVG